MLCQRTYSHFSIGSLLLVFCFFTFCFHFSLFHLNYFLFVYLQVEHCDKKLSRIAKVSIPIEEKAYRLITLARGNIDMIISNISHSDFIGFANIKANR